VVEDEIAPRVIAENERVAVGPDGAVTRQYDPVEHEPVVRRRRNDLGWAMLAILILVAAGLLAWWYFSRDEKKNAPGVTGVPVATAVNRLQGSRV
jgi:hypothetical protein